MGWEFIDLNNYLEDLLGLKVDLATRRALKKQFKDEALKEVVII